jgi:hypothetical protein
MSDDEANISGGTETASDPGAAVKSAALDQMSKSEDITAYASERADQAAEAAGEKPATPPEARVSRYQEVLNAARHETSQARQEAGLNGEAQDFDTQVEQAYAQQEAAQARDAELSHAEKYGADVAMYKARAAQLEVEHPEYWSAVQSTFSVIPPTQEIAQQILECEHGPEICWRMSQRPDAIQQLNEMNPREAERIIAKLDGAIMTERQMAKRFAANPQPRRVTNAPPPLRSPRGGANPPSDIMRLAQKDNVGDYIKARRQQEKRSRE